MVVGLVALAVVVVASGEAGLDAARVSAVTPPVPEVTLGGAPGPPRPVAPPEGSPLLEISRDGGVSVVLSDGRALWLFGDTSVVEADGSARFWRSNSAAIADPAEPEVLHEAYDAATGIPGVFLDPDEAFGGACPDGWVRATWPTAAAVHPSGSTDRGIVFYESVCGDPLDGALRSNGIGVAEWTYDPGAPPRRGPVVGGIDDLRATVLDPLLFPAPRTWGESAAVLAGGWLVAWWCEQVGPAPEDLLGCRIARARPDAVADRTAWTFWDGAAWVADERVAVPVELPDDRTPARLPAADLSVRWVDDLGALVMVYGPWPGFTHEAAVRVAHRPEGPWSPPQIVTLPDCGAPAEVGGESADDHGLPCYLPEVHPQLGDSGHLGLTWFDADAEEGPPVSGRLRTSRVPVAAPPAERFNPVHPTRVVDTRRGLGVPAARLGPGEVIELPLAGREGSGVPAHATAVSLTLTAVAPTAPTHLTVWPRGAALPRASVLNAGAGETVAVSTVARVGADGRVRIRNESGRLDVVVDLTGWFAPDASGVWRATSPRRAVDSRVGHGTPAALPGGDRTVVVDLSAGGAVPADAVAAVINLTVDRPSADTHLVAWAAGQPRPPTSVLNVAAGDTRAAAAVVPLGPGATLALANHAGTAPIIVDVVGHVSAGGDGGLRPVAPKRIVDSRRSLGLSGPLVGGDPQTVAVPEAPAGACAVLLAVAATEASDATHLRLWASDGPRPATSNLNLPAGDTRANLVVVPLGADGRIRLESSGGTRSVHVVVDVAGWMA